MNVDDHIAQLRQFRQSLYEFFCHRRDSLMGLLDALCSEHKASSVVEVSQHLLFRRGYSGLYRAIGSAFEGGQSPGGGDGVNVQPQLLELIGRSMPPPTSRDYWLFGLDGTANARLYARHLIDRESVHQATAVPGQLPITLGHHYSLLSVLPESESAGGAWAIPLSGARVSSFESPVSVGIAQVQALMQAQSVPWQDQLCVLDVDSYYSCRPFLGAVVEHPNLVVVARLRRNRVLYRCPKTLSCPGKGHPRWYGERFDLKAPQSWHPPEQTLHTVVTTAKGQCLTLTIDCWAKMLMRGNKQAPMHQHPFDLVQVQLHNLQGQLQAAPMWLIVFGQRRAELSLQQVQPIYKQRFDLEHSLRFMKQRLLLSAFQTPSVAAEQNWFILVLLAYVQLWLARPLAQCFPPPWQRYLPAIQQGRLSPTLVQRDFARIIQQIGTPARPVKPRGNSPGRSIGQTLPPRPPRPLIKRRPSRKKKTLQIA